MPARLPVMRRVPHATLVRGPVAIIRDGQQRILAREQHVGASIDHAFAMAKSKVMPRMGVVVTSYARNLADAQKQAEEAGNDPKTARAKPDHVAKENLMAIVESEMGQFADQANILIANGQIDAIYQGRGDSQAATESAMQQLMDFLRGQWFFRPNDDAIQALQGKASDGSPLDSLLQGLGQSAAAFVQETLTAGLAAGENPRDIGNALEDALNMPRNRAQVIARNEMVDSYRSAALANYQENSDVLDGWVWCADLGGRTCAMCIEMNGQTFPLDEPFDSHACCRCSAIPATAGWQDIADNLGLDEEDLDLSDLPDTSVNLPDGEQWLRQQPPQTQQQILGKGKWALWKADMLKLADLVAKGRHPQWGGYRYEPSMKELGFTKADVAKAQAKITPQAPQTLTDATLPDDWLNPGPLMAKSSAPLPEPDPLKVIPKADLIALQAKLQDVLEETLAPATRDVEAAVAKRLEGNDVYAALGKRLGWDVTKPEESQQFLNTFLQEWSNGETTTFYGLQRAIQQEFGMPEESLQSLNKTKLANAEKFYGDQMDGVRAVARAIYEETQAFFHDQGITEIPIYRGMHWGQPPQGIPTDGQYHEISLTMRPGSPFSIDPRIGTSFAFGGGDEQIGVVLAGVVPVDRIFSTGMTGVGARIEGEVTLLGGTDLPFHVFGERPPFKHYISSQDGLEAKGKAMAEYRTRAQDMLTQEAYEAASSAKTPPSPSPPLHTFAELRAMYPDETAFRDALGKQSIANLKAQAKEEGITLPKGKVTKADVIDAIVRSALTEAPPLDDYARAQADEAVAKKVLAQAKRDLTEAKKTGDADAIAIAQDAVTQAKATYDHAVAARKAMEPVPDIAAMAQQPDFEKQLGKLKIADLKQMAQDAGVELSGKSKVAIIQSIVDHFTPKEEAPEPTTTSYVRQLPQDELDATQKQLMKLLKVSGDDYTVRKQSAKGIAQRLEGNDNWQAFLDRAGKDISRDAQAVFGNTKMPQGEQAAFLLHTAWAQGGAEHNMLFYAMQEAMRREFGAVGMATDHLSEKGLQTFIKRYGDESIAGLQAYVRAVYDETQAFFKAQGITEIPVYRGMNFKKTQGPDNALFDGQYHDVEMALQPGSSFTVDPDWAAIFSGGEARPKYMVVAGVVPVEDILSIARTGYGDLGEAEVVVVGGTKAMRAYGEIQTVKQRKDDDAYNAFKDRVKGILATDEAPAQPTHAPSWDDIQRMKPIAGPHGSQEGQWYRDEKTGQEYYVKPAQSDAHAFNEVAAMRLYEAMGAVPGRDIPYTSVAKDETGQRYIVSEKLPELETKSGSWWRSNDAASTRAEAEKLWAVDVLLAHWDTAGEAHDNMLVDAEGHPIRIETGGAMGFRAQGGEKGSWKPGKPLDEAWTMRGKAHGGIPGNQQDGDIFGQISDKHAAELLGEAAKAIDLDKLRQAWKDLGMPKAQIDRNIKVLRARIDQIPKVQAELTAEAAPPKSISPENISSELASKKELRAAQEKLQESFSRVSEIQNARVLADRLGESDAWQDTVKSLLDAAKNDINWKANVLKDPEYQGLSDAEVVAHFLLGQWAKGDNPSFYAIQHAINAEFGLDATVSHLNDAQFGAFKLVYGDQTAGLQQFVRAMYDQTQEYFRQQGITRIPVYRGMSFKMDAGPPDEVFDKTYRMMDIALQPGSSFSVDPYVATEFMNAQIELVDHPWTDSAGEVHHYSSHENVISKRLAIAGYVDVEQILSTAATGFGVPDEAEVIVLGGQTRMWAYGEISKRDEIPASKVENILNKGAKHVMSDEPSASATASGPLEPGNVSGTPEKPPASLVSGMPTGDAQAMEDWLNARDDGIDWHVADVHPDVLPQVVAKLDALGKSYPEAYRYLNSVTTDGDWATMANTYAYVDSGGKTLHLNPRMFGDVAVLEAQYNHEVTHIIPKSNGLTWFVQTDLSPVDYLVTHEFGHILDFMWRLDDEAFTHTISSSGLGRVQNTWVALFRTYLMDPDMRGKISGYADDAKGGKSEIQVATERFAELFVLIQSGEPIPADLQPAVNAIKTFMRLVIGTKRYTRDQYKSASSILNPEQKAQAIDALQRLANMLGIPY